jgi:hypothetical protein
VGRCHLHAGTRSEPQEGSHVRLDSLLIFCLDYRLTVGSGIFHKMVEDARFKIGAVAEGNGSKEDEGVGADAGVDEGSGH